MKSENAYNEQSKLSSTLVVMETGDNDPTGVQTFAAEASSDGCSA